MRNIKPLKEEWNISDRTRKIIDITGAIIIILLFIYFWITFFIPQLLRAR